MGNTKMKKILYISGTRADYGLMKTTLLAIKNSPNLELEIIATGMHLMPEFGNTIEEIEKDNFKIYKIEAVYKNDKKESMAGFIGKFVLLLAEKIKEIKPDIILLLGDRAEALGSAIVGAYLGIPVVHIHGGEESGTVDDKARKAISFLADFHLPATKESAKRIGSKAIVVGAPGLEENLGEEQEIISKYRIDIKRPLLLVIQHPVSEEADKSGWQMEQTMEAVKELGFQAIVIYSNADAGGREIIKVIEEYRKYPLISIYKNIPRNDFLTLMKLSKAMVGNSSSGMIEASSFNLPVVNIGTRQGKRERGDNVINVDYNKEKIKKAILKAVKTKKKYKNPYFIKGTSKKITKFLKELKNHDKQI